MGNINTCPRCKKELPEDAVLCCYCGRTIVRRPICRINQRPNGTGTAYKRGKYWTAVVTVKWTVDSDGKVHQIRRTKGGFATKTDALKYCQILRNGTDRDLTRVPMLEEYWTMYESGELQKLSKSKQVAYTIAWKKMRSIYYMPVNTITVADLRRVVSSNAPTYYPARDMKVLLNHLFRLAGADGWVNNQLPEYIILPDLNEKERQPFTIDEQAALWRLYESGDTRAALPLIMIYTGMMPGEMQSLRCDMVHTDSAQIIGVGMKTKVRKESPVYLPDCIIPVLIDEMAASASKSGYVWARNEKAFYERYYAALEAAGCRRLEPYSCRHTTATALAITENIAPKTIQKIMRWSSSRMIDRYAHPDHADALAAVNTMKKR